MTSKTQQLEAAIAAKTQQRADIKARYNGLIDQLASTPNDEAISTALTQAETEIARATASIGALEEALERSLQADAAAARAAALEATEGERQLLLKLARERGKVAAEVDQAAAVFIDALRRWRVASEPMVAPAHKVMKARTNPNSFVPFFLLVKGHVSGTGGSAGTALTEIAQRAYEVLEPDHVRQLVVFNAFTRDKGATFVKANEEALKVATERTK